MSPDEIGDLSGTPSADPEIRKRQLQLLDLEIESKRTQVQKDKRPKKWWQSAIEMLALPTAVVTIAGGIITATDALHPSRSNESPKVVTSAPQNTPGAPANVGSATQGDTRKLEATQTLKEPSAILTRSVAKFILLWILFNMVGLLFDVVDRVWGLFLGGGFLSFTAYQRRLTERTEILRRGEPDEPDLSNEAERLSRRRERLQQYSQISMFVLSQAPSILRWSIQLSLFYVLLAPLFDEISIAFGSTTRFAEIVRELEHFQFSHMFAAMRQLLFG
jgi:hypothetical protein